MACRLSTGLRGRWIVRTDLSAGISCVPLPRALRGRWVQALQFGNSNIPPSRGALLGAVSAVPFKHPSHHGNCEGGGAQPARSLPSHPSRGAAQNCSSTTLLLRHNFRAIAVEPRERSAQPGVGGRSARGRTRAETGYCPEVRWAWANSCRINSMRENRSSANRFIHCSCS